MDTANREKIHRVWDDLADFGADQTTNAVSRLMAFLIELSGAWNATWAGAIRVPGSQSDGPLQGWRVAALQALHPVPPHPREDHFRQLLRIWDKREIDPSFLLPMRDVGTFRTYSLRRELPADWFESPLYEYHYGAVGTHDAVFVAFPMNQDCESHFGFYAAERFTDEAIETLAYALRGIKWFHRKLLLSHGLLMASSPPTAAERRVLELLLTDANEKQIAIRLNLTAATAHQYVVSIYRKFGVRSRAGLMTLWLTPAS